MAHNELLDRHETEKAMLVHDESPETLEITTEDASEAESSTPTQRPDADGPGAAGPARRRRRRRWVSALAATGAVVGIVTIAPVTQSDQDPTGTVPVSDDSSDVAEANRFERLRDQATAP